MRFTFPRQPSGKHLCLADFFAAQDSELIDVVAFHLVTMGSRASEYSQELFKSDNYAEYLYFHSCFASSIRVRALVLVTLHVRTWRIRLSCLSYWIRRGSALN